MKKLNVSESFLRFMKIKNTTYVIIIFIIYSKFIKEIYFDKI